MARTGGDEVGTLGALLAIGAGRLAQLIPELAAEFTVEQHPA